MGAGGAAFAEWFGRARFFVSAANSWAGAAWGRYCSRMLYYQYSGRYRTLQPICMRSYRAFIRSVVCNRGRWFECEDRLRAGASSRPENLNGVDGLGLPPLAAYFAPYGRAASRLADWPRSKLFSFCRFSRGPKIRISG